MALGRITRSEIEETRREILLEQERSGAACLDLMMENGGEDLSVKGLLRQFFAIVLLLSDPAKAHELSKSERTRLVELASNVLKLLQIPPATSALSYLHGELELVKSLIAELEGESDKAEWSVVQAGIVAGRSPENSNKYLLGLAKHALRTGDILTALEIGSEYPSENDQQSQRLQLGLICVRAHNLSQNVAVARKIADELLATTQDLPTVPQELLWQKVAFGPDCKSAELHLTVARTELSRLARYQLLAQLHWAAAPTAIKWTQFPQLAWLRRKHGPEYKHDPGLVRLHEAVNVIRQAYDYETPLHFRTQKLGTLLTKVKMLAELEEELLILAACSRFCYRSQQYIALSRFLHRYRGLSLIITKGLSADALGLLGDIPENVVAEYARKTRGQPDVTENSVVLRSGSAARLGTMAKIGYGIGVTKARYYTRRLFAKDEQKLILQDREQQEIAHWILSQTSFLKGPMIKVLQAANLMGNSLPKGIIDAAEKSLDRVPPIPRADLEKVLRKETGGQIRKVFREFDFNSVAGGSLGQIHRGTLLDGTEVAVKLQYPNIHQAVESDIRNLRLLMPFLKGRFPAIAMRDLIVKTEEGFRHELDYRREARMQNRLRDYYRDAAEIDIYVPTAFEEVSTSRMLVNEYIEGERLIDFKARTRGDHHDDMGRAILKTTMGSFLHGPCFNADPHPGNFLVMPDGGLAQLDFGFCFDYPVERRRLWQKLFQARLEGQFANYRVALIDLGHTHAPNQFDFEFAFLTMDRILHFGTSAPDFRMNSGSARQLAAEITVSAKNRRFLTLPSEDNVLPRFLLATLLTLQCLETSLDWPQVWRELVEQPAAALRRPG